MKYGGHKRRGRTSNWVIFVSSKDYPIGSTPSPFVPAILQKCLLVRGFGVSLPEVNVCRNSIRVAIQRR